jgi:hypothetical protein
MKGRVINTHVIFFSRARAFTRYLYVLIPPPPSPSQYEASLDPRFDALRKLPKTKGEAAEFKDAFVLLAKEAAAKAKLQAKEKAAQAKV